MEMVGKPFKNPGGAGQVSPLVPDVGRLPSHMPTVRVERRKRQDWVWTLGRALPAIGAGTITWTLLIPAFTGDEFAAAVIATVAAIYAMSQVYRLLGGRYD